MVLKVIWSLCLITCLPACSLVMMCSNPFQGGVFKNKLTWGVRSTQSKASTMKGSGKQKRLALSLVNNNMGLAAYIHCVSGYGKLSFTFCFLSTSVSCTCIFSIITCMFSGMSQLLEMLESYAQFEIDEITGEALTMHDRIDLHYNRINDLQVSDVISTPVWWPGSGQWSRKKE